MSVPLAVSRRAAICIGVVLASSAPASAVELVTAQEASYPDDPYGETRGSPTAGPQVEIVSPAVTALIKSPFQLKVRFRAHGGASIDAESIAITYRKVPAVDVTQRIKPFIAGDTIDIKDAELPSGAHAFRIDVRDSRGRWAAPFFFKISVAK
jgi:hypothetical protein